MEIIWWEYRKQYSYSNVPTIKSMSCCCCYVTSVVSDSVRPQGQQPTRLRHPWDSPGKNTGVGCHFLLQCMEVKSEGEVSVMSDSATPWTAAYQAPLSMGFSRQEYWSGVPLPSPTSSRTPTTVHEFSLPLIFIVLHFTYQYEDNE